MAERTITCEDCGAPYVTKRTNTKYCRLCRLLRNVLYLRDKTSVCIGCDKTYAPLLREKFAVCGDCFPGSWGNDATGRCSFCDTDGVRLLDPDVAVCRDCAQNPDKRELFVKALLKKQAIRRREHS